MFILHNLAANLLSHQIMKICAKPPVSFNPMGPPFVCFLISLSKVYTWFLITNVNATLNASLSITRPPYSSGCLPGKFHGLKRFSLCSSLPLAVIVGGLPLTFFLVGHISAIPNSVSTSCDTASARKTPTLQSLCPGHWRHFQRKHYILSQRWNLGYKAFKSAEPIINQVVVLLVIIGSVHFSYHIFRTHTYGACFTWFPHFREYETHHVWQFAAVAYDCSAYRSDRWSAVIITVLLVIFTQSVQRCHRVVTTCIYHIVLYSHLVTRLTPCVQNTDTRNRMAVGQLL